MHMVILGSGVIGVANAYYLAKAGHQVTVLDRQESPAMETSFANAGEISPGYASPWAAPGLPWKAIKWMLQAHSPLVVRPRLDPAMWGWMARALRNCTQTRYAINKERMLRLAQYSRSCLAALRAETGIAYDQRTRGTLQLFRDQQGLDGAAKDTAILDRFGVPYRVLDRAGCIAAEPALRLVVHKVAGGLQLPGDETGDCYKFTNALAKTATDLGVVFRFVTTIRRLLHEGDRISGVETEQGMVKGDVYIVAMGSYSPLLLRPLGIRMPVYPVKGYSATLPVVDAAAAPESTVMDEQYKVAITRLGDRIRAAGTAELSGYDRTLRPERCETIRFVVQDLFPRGGDPSRIEYWTGLRPMTPDGTPVIGSTHYSNLFLNTGHGTLGWTMACGSGRVVSDLVTGKAPEIATDDLNIRRYA